MLPDPSDHSQPGSKEDTPSRHFLSYLHMRWFAEPNCLLRGASNQLNKEVYKQTNT